MLMIQRRQGSNKRRERNKLIGSYMAANEPLYEGLAKTNKQINKQTHTHTHCRS
jgi:hypothetical protein